MIHDAPGVSNKINLEVLMIYTIQYNNGVKSTLWSESARFIKGESERPVFFTSSLSLGPEMLRSQMSFSYK